MADRHAGASIGTDRELIGWLHVGRDRWRDRLTSLVGIAGVLWVWLVCSGFVAGCIDSCQMVARARDAEPRVAGPRERVW